MAQILKFPVQASKFGYKRVKKRGQLAESPGQLDLFPKSKAQILSFSPETNWFERALLLDELGDDKAADFYLKAIEENNCVADAYCNLGIIESQRGNISKALDHFTASLKKDPRHLESHYNLGNLYFEVNDHRLAQVHYEMAVEVEPSFPNVYFNLALVQAMNIDLSSAITSLTRYQELVSEEEAQGAAQLLESLRRSLASQQSVSLS